MNAVGGTLQRQRDVTSAGEHVAGREFVVHAVTPGSGKAFEMVVRLFRVGDAVYLVQAIGPRTDASREDRQAVVESFAVLLRVTRLAAPPWDRHDWRGAPAPHRH